MVPRRRWSPKASKKGRCQSSAREVDRSRLLRMQLEPETREYQLHAPSRLLDLRLRVAHHHKIIGIADQRTQRRTPVFPYPVEDMQVDVREQWRDDPALRRARR